jgi:hypothetical protein
MALTGRVLTLDISTKTGWCVGSPSSGIERCGVEKLKDPEDEPRRAGRKLGMFLRDQFSMEDFELVVVEAAMNPAAMMGANNSAYATALAWRLVGAVDAVCGCYGIRVVDVQATAHRKFVTGQSRWGDRKEAKRQAIAGVKRLGLWPAGQRDSDDLADAIALFAYSISAFGNKHLGEFALQGAAR